MKTPEPLTNADPHGEELFVAKLRAPQILRRSLVHLRPEPFLVGSTST